METAIVIISSIFSVASITAFFYLVYYVYKIKILIQSIDDKIKNDTKQEQSVSSKVTDDSNYKKMTINDIYKK
jgi:cell division protein FtsL